ncbi:pyochelin biosynthetic protein PchC [Streptomyces sp. Amel2xB2]|nr:pyochelin biosynthetic protein PchC [Streptomyces sp. Amel2xB2]
MNGPVRQPASAWLRAYATPGAAPAEVRLVCFPHAGGSASFYRDWAGLLPAHVELLAVCYPGREDRFGEECAAHLADLADPIAEALAADAESPLVLFGHSMGAAVAAEVALRLEKRERARPQRLFVSGREGPGAERGSELRSYDDDALAAEVLRLGGHGAEIMDQPGVRELLFPVLRADYRLIDSYRPGPGLRLTTPVTALSGESDPACTAEESRVWSSATSGSFELHSFPGDHFFLVPCREQVVGLVAERLPAARG